MRVSTCLFVLVPLIAWAHPNGQTGYSGKGGGQTCNACHSGGTTPTVTLAGPSTLSPGQTATYTLTISGGAGSVAGLDVALTGGGTLAPATTDTQLLNGEITHKTAGLFSGGSASFTFKVTAPGAASSLTLNGTGNSCNGNGNDTGDKSGVALLSIQVSGAGTGGGAGGGSGGGGSAGGGSAGGGSAGGAAGGSAGGSAGGAAGGSAGGSAVGTGGGGQPPGDTGGVGGGSAPASAGGGGEVAGPTQSINSGLIEGDFGCSSTAGLPGMALIIVVAVMVVARSRRTQRQSKEVFRILR